jgi:hypothetical protein
MKPSGSVTLNSWHRSGHVQQQAAREDDEQHAGDVELF